MFCLAGSRRLPDSFVAGIKVAWGLGGGSMVSAPLYSFGLGVSLSPYSGMVMKGCVCIDPGLAQPHIEAGPEV